MWEAEGTKLQNICFRLQFLKFFFFGSLPSPRAGGCDSRLSESLVSVDSINFDLRLWTSA